MTRRYHVGIAGFGIAGGALAVMLARSGHQVTLFERASQAQPVGAGLLLQHSGQAVLRRMNLLEQIVARSEPIYEINAYKRNGGKLVQLRYGEVLSGGCAYGVHRGLIFETLLTAVRSETVDLQLNTEILNWKNSGTQIVAIDNHGHEHGAFDFLVGADGNRSHLRVRLNPELKAREYDYGAMWAVGKNSQVRHQLQQFTKGARNLLGLLPMGNEQCTLFWGLRQDQIRKVKECGFAAWRGELLKLCPQAEETLDDIGSFERVIFSGYQHLRPRRIHHGNIVLIGDAAHSMSPHLGQGANLALADAECLAEFLRAEPDPHTAFTRYAETRRTQIRYYSQLSRWLSPFFQSDSLMLGLGRDIALPLMCAVPPLRRVMELSVAGISTGWGQAVKALFYR
jgi:2-polyprenyl-6-methoxyphenol hydroxylase-like FAD-dependent oxidoreductase